MCCGPGGRTKAGAGQRPYLALPSLGLARLYALQSPPHAPSLLIGLTVEVRQLPSKRFDQLTCCWVAAVDQRAGPASLSDICTPSKPVRDAQAALSRLFRGTLPNTLLLLLVCAQTGRRRASKASECDAASPASPARPRQSAARRCQHRRWQPQAAAAAAAAGRPGHT